MSQDHRVRAGRRPQGEGGEMSDDVGYEPARDSSGNAIYIDADGRVVDLPSFIAPPHGWRALFVQTAAVHDPHQSDRPRRGRTGSRHGDARNAGGPRTAKPKLTDLDLEVLRAAAREDRSLYRSEATKTLYDSFLVGLGMRRRVNRQVDKLTGLAEPLLRIGERDRFVRPWLITDAGRAVLAEHEEHAR